MVKKVCHFQIFKSKEEENDILCALACARAEKGQSNEYPCNPKNCPIYQSWKMVAEKGASLRML